MFNNAVKIREVKMIETCVLWLSMSHPLETQGHIPENDNELRQYMFICNSNSDRVLYF